MEEKKILTPGKWYAEFDEKGELTKSFHDKTYRDILGYETEEEYADVYGKWMGGIHPDDRKRLEDYLIETREDRKNGLDYDIEYRMMTKWGYRWFHDYAKCTRRENGSLERWDGIVIDINDAKTMNPNLGALPISHDVLKQSNIGLWAFELNEGSEPRMYGDEAMMKLLGVEGPATPEEVYHAWYDHIDKDHYDEVHESVDKMAAGLHSEVQYPWHYADGRTIIVRCGGIRNPKYTKGLRIEGVHRDVTTLVHYEKEKELQKQVEEFERINKKFINSYNIVYKVNIQDDSFITLRMDSDMIGHGLNFDVFSKALKFFAADIVFERDRAKMLHETDYKTIRNKLKFNPTYTVEYRVLINGVATWHEMTIASLEGNQILIGFAPKNMEIILKKLSHKMNDDFYALYSIDLDTEFITVLKNAPWYTIAAVGQSAKYSTVMKTFLKDVHGDAKTFFSQFIDINKVKKAFTTEDKQSFNYLSASQDRWINISFYVIIRHEDGTPAVITFGFSYVDSVESERQRLQDLNRENMEIIGGFTSDYLALYYLNLDENSFKVYSIDSSRISDTSLLLTEDTDPFALIKKFANSPAVHPDDRELFLVITKDGIRELLKDRKRTSIRFRRDYGQGYKWSVMDVVKYEKTNEKANAVVIGFAECDAEVRSEQTVANSLAILCKEMDPSTSINELLSLAGAFYGAERAYIFEYGKNRDKINNTYEWCAEDVEPMIDKLQNVPAEFIDVWINEFKKSGAFYMSSLKDDPQTSKEGAELLAMQGITSLIAAPIMKGNEIEGFIGIDNPTHAIKNLEVLKVSSTIAFSEILRRKEDDEEHVTLSKLTDAFLSVYYVDVSIDYMRTWKIANAYQKEYGITKKYSESMGGYVRNYVAKRDQERAIAMTQPEYILEQFKKKDRFNVEMTDIYTGIEVNVVFDFIKISEDGTKFVVCAKDVTESISKQKEQQELLERALSESRKANAKISEQSAFTSFFLKPFRSAYYIDLNTLSCQIYKRSQDLDDNYPILSNYLESLDQYIKKEVHPDYQQKITELTRPQKMRELLSQQDEFFYVYKLISEGEDKTFRLQVIRGADENHAAFGFKDVTEELRIQQEQQSNLEKALHDSQEANAKIAHQKLLLDYFVQSYTSAYSVDLKNDDLEVLHIDNESSSIVKLDGTRDDMNKFISEHVHANDRELLFQMTDKDYVIQRLQKERFFTFTFKEIYGSNTKAMRGIIVRGIDEYHIAVGFMDITEELRKEREQQERLQEALSMAQSANRAKTTFLNNMSHDIRTPMNAIIGYTGLAASHIDNKEQVQDYLSKISQSSDHLLSLINDVLDMSRIESGKMNLQEREENLSDIIHTLRDIVQADVHSKQMDFYVDAVDVNDEDIICDKLRLNQVLLNVLSNAIKYTAPGGTVTLRVKEKTIKENGYGTYEFCIKDNGMGMSKEFLETIYDPFTRVKSSTVSGIQGTGLGMAITKNIVDMMGGTIDIQSDPGKGTEVKIVFDFKFQSEHKPPCSIPELNGVRALVVDDDSNTCISISKMLRDINMVDEWCTSGKEAVIRAKDAYQRGEQFKVYIIDWLMPDMNGIETTRRIRKVIGNDTPIIILTAYDWSDIEDEARDAGVTSFVSKPMFPSDLHRVLNHCLGKDEPKTEAQQEILNFTSKKVLLVEDNEFNREIASELLQEYGFKVTSAVNGKFAVDIMKKAKKKDFDLILMDVQMPIMDGYEATKCIRALKSEISNIPIIAMTANAFEEDRKIALEVGMNEHIAKPFDFEKMKATLTKILSNKK